MTQVNNYSQNMPVNNGYVQQVPQNQVATPQVNVTTPNGVTPVYQYPTTSVYDANSKQATSGVNIIINNPSGMGMGGCSCPNACFAYPGASTINHNLQAQIPTPQAPVSQAPIANTSINDENSEVSDKDKKDVIAIDDNYVKTVEGYLRSPDEEIRKMGVTELIKRFEEDNSRYNHPALNALLNIALQDSSAHNRLLAMSPIATESAHGDENTAKLLQGLTQSDKLKGQEAKMAQEALLKTVHSKTV